MSSVVNDYRWTRINNNYAKFGGIPNHNNKGVRKAIKEYFSFEFDENKYLNSTFNKDNISWQIIHYPYCNGLTVIKKLNH
jgi:hypothetical protein